MGEGKNWKFGVFILGIIGLILLFSAAAVLGVIILFIVIMIVLIHEGLKKSVKGGHKSSSDKKRDKHKSSSDTNKQDESAAWRPTIWQRIYERKLLENNERKRIELKK
ncbi:MAG: ABC transporter permease [Candidatus Omnitrophota bacterium]